MTHDEMAAMAVRVVAEHSARKMVRERLRQRGVKLSYVPARREAQLRTSEGNHSAS
jgi:hypothetical protein